jgi:butyrate kinase
MGKFKVLVINPGSTSTKIAVYDDFKPVFVKTLSHSLEQLGRFVDIGSQYEFRKDTILSELVHAEIDLDEIDAVIGRGGLLRPIESGVYEVNEDMKRDLKKGILGQHAANLGGLIAADLVAHMPGARAFIADPVVVDELQDVARVTGFPELPAQSIFHALNQKAVARNFAFSIERPYEELDLIVAHLGGGVSVGAHHKGKVIEVNNALDGNGPFSPERAGTLPAGALVDLCFSGKYTRAEIRKKISGEGGLVAHLGTNQAHEAESRALNGDEHAEFILHAMAYQIAKAISGCAAALKGHIDGILLTGGMAHNKMVVGFVRQYIDWLAPVKVYPGEDEMKALASNALSVLKGNLECKKY